MKTSWLAVGAAALLLAGLPGIAGAQAVDNTRTVFVIGDINAGTTYPVRAYAVSGDQLMLSATWHPLDRNGGPVGIGVDPINEHMFISYEFSGTLDVFDATDATPLGQISLVSPDPLNPVDDIAGMDVHEGNGQLFVVDRGVKYVYVFDTSTYDSVDTWELPTGNGGWDVEIIEDLGGQDLIFITDATNVVRWYDIDTHAEIGTATMAYISLGLGVYIKTGDYPVLFTGSISGSHPPPDSPYLTKTDTETGDTDSVQVGPGSARGIGVNQQAGYVYASIGEGTGFTPPTVRVYDWETLTELSRTNLGNGWSPTDVDATWLAFGSSVKKESSTHPTGDVNMTEEIVFEITVENRSSRPIHVLPLKDIYNTAHLTYLFSEAPYTSDDNTDDGEIDWSDLIAQRGSDLPYGETITVVAHFRAEPEGCTNFVRGENLARMTGVLDDLGDPVEDSAGTFAYKLTCECVVDADCDDGQYCNGAEICNDANQCESPGNPCPLDDGVFCNGDETFECIEATDECGHSGDPCVDDGLFCNGGTVCNEEAATCDDTGNPCDEGEECDERIDVCAQVDDEPPDEDGDDDTVPPPPLEEPEEPGDIELVGGCCGCGS
ncbi:MAG: hypothetical protein M5R36_07255 [Deltaproteobacteria bacterium]|nr:hypothetical protein [Deltaproteobacteria bacterium]